MKTLLTSVFVGLCFTVSFGQEIFSFKKAFVSPTDDFLKGNGEIRISDSTVVVEFLGTEAVYNIESKAGSGENRTYRLTSSDSPDLLTRMTIFPNVQSTKEPWVVLIEYKDTFSGSLMSMMYYSTRSEVEDE